MIEIKVIDTENGNMHPYSKEKAVNYKFEIIGGVDKKYKAVPSITIDGVEYYHGMVCETAHGNKFVIIYGHLKDRAGEFYGWYVRSEEPFLLANSLGNWYNEQKQVGNIWQPEYRHLLPLLEV